MTRHDDTTRLRHMLDYARKAARLTAGRARADLDSDELFGLAMTRLLEVIGGAAAMRHRGIDLLLFIGRKKAR
jgi:uncharacterized protein with HEPN domain